MVVCELRNEELGWIQGNERNILETKIEEGGMKCLSIFIKFLIPARG
jgi:hypothetical protein